MPTGYDTKAWQDARHAALTRARHRCELCGRTQSLLVHHLDGQGTRGPRAYDQRNLQVLCRPCHQDEHVDLRPWPPHRG